MLARVVLLLTIALGATAAIQTIPAIPSNCGCEAVASVFLDTTSCQEGNLGGCNIACSAFNLADVQTCTGCMVKEGCMTQPEADGALSDLKKACPGIDKSSSNAASASVAAGAVFMAGAAMFI